MCGVKERIEILKKETTQLREEVKNLKEALLQQNELIISLLSQQNGFLDETREAERQLPLVLNDKQISELSRRFPLDNFKNLAKFEADINDENENVIINIIQNLLAPKGLSKSISNVLSENIIIDMNVDGFQNKKRLLNFPKTIHILFQASRKDNEEYNTQKFLNDLRKALRIVKSRIYKNNFYAKQKLREQTEQEQLMHTAEEFIKTEIVDLEPF